MGQGLLKKLADLEQVSHSAVARAEPPAWTRKVETLPVMTG
jgi:hypothetical protein